MKLKKFKVFVFALLIGGGIAMVGYVQFRRQSAGLQIPKLAERIKKTHTTPMTQLVFTLYSNYNIETVAQNPQLVKDFLQNKENLSVNDHAALEQLIEKVTSK